LVKNTAHSSLVTGILETALLQGSYSDVTISVGGSRRVIRCHQAVLANISPYIRSLLEDRPDPQEAAHLHFCGLEFGEAMAILNLVYAGRCRWCRLHLTKSLFS